MNIKEVEQQVGLSSKNIRFYEDEGLIKIPRNAQNGYREFDEVSIQRLQEIKMLRQLGVSLEVIRLYQKHTMSLQEVMEKRLQEIKEENETNAQMKQMCEAIQKSEASFTPYMLEQCGLQMRTKQSHQDLPSMGKKQMKTRIFWACYPFALIMSMLVYYGVVPMLFSGLAAVGFINETTALQFTNNIFTFALSVLLAIILAMILNVYYRGNRERFFEMKEDGMYYINPKQHPSKTKLSWAVLKGKTQQEFDFLSYQDIYKVTVGQRVVGATSYTASKLFELVFRIGTRYDENITLASGMVGQDPKGILLLIDVLKQYADVIVDPYHLMDIESLSNEEYYERMNQAFQQRIHKNQTQHRHESLWD